MCRPAFLLALVLAGCTGDPSPSHEPAGADSAAVAAATPLPSRASRLDGRSEPPPSEAPTPFDHAAVVFDTLEPLPPRVEIQPRPEPPPRPDPALRPVPAPRPAPPEPPPARAAGSCDVRTTESFCFAYTGSGWSPREARQHCGNAPESAYRSGACPEADAIATCRFFRDDAPAQEIVYTYYAPYALALAELACPGDFERIAGD